MANVPRTVWRLGPALALLLAVLVLLPAFPSAVSAQCLDFDDYAHILSHLRREYGVQDIAKSGDVLYMSHANTFDVVDLSDPARPEIVDTFEASGVWELEVQPGTLFVIAGGRIDSYDITTPTQPVLAASHPFGGSEAALRDGLLYVLRNTEGDPFVGTFNIYDVADPTAITLVGSVGGLPYSGPKFDLGADHAYLCSMNDLVTVSIADPSAPAVVATTPLGERSADVVVGGGYAYVGTWDGLFVLDLAVPAAPVKAALLPGIAWQGQVLELEGDELWIGSRDLTDEGFLAVDVSDPLDPVAGPFHETADGVWALIPEATTLFVGETGHLGGGGLSVYDLSSREPIPYETISGFDAWIDDLCVQGEYLYVADGASLAILDISVDPPAAMSTLATAGLRDMTVSGGRLVAGSLAGIELFDVSNPTAPAPLATVPLASGALQVAMSGGVAYVAAGLDGLLVYDLSVPSAPVLLGSFDFPSADVYFLKIAVRGNHAYVECDNHFLAVFDVSSPEAIEFLGSVRPSSGFYDLAVDHDLLFALGFWELVVYDVLNPAHPVEVGRTPIPGFGDSIELLGSDLFMALGETGLVVADVRDPTQPVVHGSYVSGTDDVAFGGEWVYYAGGGLRRAPAPCPVCGDGLWEDGEICGADARAATGFADMNHDCLTDFVDLCIFDGSLGLSGPGLEGDFNGDWVVDLQDVGLFAGAFVQGAAVSPCTSAQPWEHPVGGTLRLSFDPDPAVDAPRLDAEPGIVLAYLVADGTAGAAGIECLLTTSPNVSILGVNARAPYRMLTRLCTPPAGGEYLPLSAVPPQHDDAVVVATVILDVLDDQPGFVSIVEGSGDCSGVRVRWVDDQADHSVDFLSVRHAGLNGEPPGSPVDVPAAAVLGLGLECHPNPFNPRTTLSFRLAEAADVSLRVYDLSGGLVRNLLEGIPLGAGGHEATWDGRDATGRPAAAGAYVARLQAGGRIAVQRMLLVK